MKSLCNNHEFKISASTWNDEFELPDGSYSVPHSEITEVVLVHCYIVNNDYQEDSRVLYTFVSKNFGIWHFIRNCTNKFHILNDI